MNISLAAEPLFHIGTFPVTNTLLVGLFITLAGGIFVAVLRKRLEELPRGIQNVVEALIEGMLKFVDGVTVDRKKTLRFFPIAASIFTFVLLSNWVELVPGLGTIGIWGEHQGETVLIPFLRSASADLNVTAAIALFAVASVQIMGMMVLGVRRYASKFLVPPWHPPYGIGTFVGILEIVSEFARMISFSFRLFGNIFAGEVLLLVVSTLVPYIIPMPFLFLELFVGLVQALVFSMLTLVFLTMATESH